VTIAFVNGDFGSTTGSSATQVQSAGANHSTNNLLVVFIAYVNNVTVQSITDTAGNDANYAFIARKACGSTPNYIEVWCCPNITGNASNVLTVTVSGACGGFLAIVDLQYSGAATSSPVDTYGVGDDGGVPGTNLSTAASTIHNTGEMLVAGYFCEEERTFTPGANFTLRTTVKNTETIGTEEYLLPGTGSYGSAITANNNSYWGGICCGLIAAGAGGGISTLDTGTLQELFSVLLSFLGAAPLDTATIQEIQQVLLDLIPSYKETATVQELRSLLLQSFLSKTDTATIQEIRQVLLNLIPSNLDTASIQELNQVLLTLIPSNLETISVKDIIAIQIVLAGQMYLSGLDTATIQDLNNVMLNFLGSSNIDSVSIGEFFTVMLNMLGSSGLDTATISDIMSVAIILSYIQISNVESLTIQDKFIIVTPIWSFVSHISSQIWIESESFENNLILEDGSPLEFEDNEFFLFDDQSHPIWSTPAGAIGTWAKA
jgi:hypothetical protein